MTKHEVHAQYSFLLIFEYKQTRTQLAANNIIHKSILVTFEIISINHHHLFFLKGLLDQMLFMSYTQCIN